MLLFEGCAWCRVACSGWFLAWVVITVIIKIRGTAQKQDSKQFTRKYESSLSFCTRDCEALESISKSAFGLVAGYLHIPYEVWNAYKEHRHTAIPAPDSCDLCALNFTDDELEVLEEVWNTYGELSARQLEHLTHTETPWLDARKGVDPGEKSQEVISHEKMKSYYEKYVVED